MLKFEGVYMNAFVYVNGQLAAKSPFGYTTFYAPLNDFLKIGEDNEIRVQVRTGAMTNSRWYSGAGIYRDVYLLESELTHIIPEGVQIKTENADEDYATLKVSVELENKTAAPQNLVVETVIRDSEGKETGKEVTHATLFGSEKRTVKQRILVENPSLWSAESPSLYTYETKVYEDTAEKKLLDEAKDTSESVLSL